MHHLPKESTEHVLTQVELSDQARKSVAKLTPPARRRVAFARLLMGNPGFLLLDHPTLRTDLEAQNLFARLLKQKAQEGAAVLLTCEDLSWAGKFCTHIVELGGGRVIDCRRNEASAPTASSEVAEEGSAIPVTSCPLQGPCTQGGSCYPL